VNGYQRFGLRCCHSLQFLPRRRWFVLRKLHYPPVRLHGAIIFAVCLAMIWVPWLQNVRGLWICTSMEYWCCCSWQGQTEEPRQKSLTVPLHPPLIARYCFFWSKAGIMFAESASDHLSHRSHTHTTKLCHTYFGTFVHVSAINRHIRTLKCKEVHHTDILTFWRLTSTIVVVPHR